MDQFLSKDFSGGSFSVTPGGNLDNPTAEPVLPTDPPQPESTAPHHHPLYDGCGVDCQFVTLARLEPGDRSMDHTNHVAAALMQRVCLSQCIYAGDAQRKDL